MTDSVFSIYRAAISRMRDKPIPLQSRAIKMLMQRENRQPYHIRTEICQYSPIDAQRDHLPLISQYPIFGTLMPFHMIREGENRLACRAPYGFAFKPLKFLYPFSSYANLLSVVYFPQHSRQFPNGLHPVQHLPTLPRRRYLIGSPSLP